MSPLSAIQPLINEAVHEALKDQAACVVFHLALTAELGRMELSDAIDVCTGALEMTEDQAEEVLASTIAGIITERLEKEMDQ
ncbi:hypothetical protein ACIOHC_23380 [Streptomyces sp. NPDC088252]|uniref:hypothetical protein n=1 Tax=Streptomyces sp. NPDC088252 TaxID=3365845 RepID=UPI00381575D7